MEMRSEMEERESRKDNRHSRWSGLGRVEGRGERVGEGRGEPRGTVACAAAGGGRVDEGLRPEIMLMACLLT